MSWFQWAEIRRIVLEECEILGIEMSRDAIFARVHQIQEFIDA